GCAAAGQPGAAAALAGRNAGQGLGDGSPADGPRVRTLHAGPGTRACRRTYGAGNLLGRRAGSLGPQRGGSRRIAIVMATAKAYKDMLQERNAAFIQSYNLIIL